MKYLLLLVPLISGCVTTSVRSFSDNAYKGHQIKKVVVNGGKSRFGQQLETKIVKKISPNTISNSYFSEFPPTRTYGGDQVQQTLLNKGYDSMLVIEFKGGNKNTKYAGTFNSGSASWYGGGGYGSVYGSGMSIPMYTTTANITITATLFDLRTRKKMWVGNFNTNAQDFSANIPAMAENASNTIIKDLKTKGHIR